MYYILQQEDGAYRRKRRWARSICDIRALETYEMEGIGQYPGGAPHNLASEQSHGVLTRRILVHGYPYIKPDPAILY